MKTLGGNPVGCMVEGAYPLLYNLCEKSAFITVRHVPLLLMKVDPKKLAQADKLEGKSQSVQTLITEITLAYLNIHFCE